MTNDQLLAALTTIKRHNDIDEQLNQLDPFGVIRAHQATFSTLPAYLTNGNGLINPVINITGKPSIGELQKQKQALSSIANLPPYSELLKTALDNGVDLRSLYGTTYSDAVKFKQDLGQYGGKDASMIIPANPVGYSGGFKFDPNFGSAAYRELAMASGKALGLDDETIFKKGTEFFADQFASGERTKGTIGFKDFGTELLDSLATTAGVAPERLEELRGTVLKPLYDANQQLFSSLSSGAAVESQSSGFFKGIGQSIAELGPIGTIALTAALGPAAGALAGSLGGGAALAAGLAAGGASAIPGLLQGDLSGALKSGLTGGALAGIGSGLLSDVAPTVSDALGGGSLGDIAGSATTGAIKGGLSAAIRGGDIGQGLLGGALQSGVTTGANELLGQTGSFIDQQQRANQEFFGLNPNATSPTISFGDPNNFGPQFSLPDTTGFVNFAPTIGSQFDGMKFPQTGLNLNTGGLLNLGDGVGQGLLNPSSPTLSGQLGQGLTVGVNGGTLGQGGVTPTGQINLGDPASFINGGKAPARLRVDPSRLLRGLLGGGAVAAAGGLLGANRPRPPAAPPKPAMPINKYKYNSNKFQYGGDLSTYGTGNLGGFQFYKSNIGLLE